MRATFMSAPPTAASEPASSPNWEPSHAWRRQRAQFCRQGAAYNFAPTILPACSEAMSQLHDKLISPVPSHIVDQAPLALTAYEGRVAEFNVASWLQLHGQAGLSVSLVMKYRDGQQRREAAVDHGRTDSNGRILLSGVARLIVRSRIEDLQVYLRAGVEIEQMKVEELFVQAAERIEAPAQLIQA